MSKKNGAKSIVLFAFTSVILAGAWLAVRPPNQIVTRNSGQIPTTLAFSPDGSLLASGGWGRTLNIFDGNIMQHRATVTGFKNVVHPLVFSPDGKTIAAGESMDSIYLIDSASGARLRKFTGHTDQLISAAFSADGKYLATGGFDKVVIVWDVRTGKLLHKLWGQKNGVGRTLFTPDGKTIITTDYECIRLFDVESGKLQRRIPLSMGYPVAFSYDGKFCVGTNGGATKVWETANWSVVHTFVDSGFRSIDVSQAKIVVATKAELKIRDFYSGILLQTDRVSERASPWPNWLLRMFPKLRPGPVSTIACVAISRDGSKVAAALQDGTIQMQIQR